MNRRVLVKVIELAGIVIIIGALIQCARHFR